MNSLQLEYFLTLCKYRNYSETARRLYVSQPTVSKQIAALENELRLKLFNRSKTSIELTPEGQIMKTAFEESIELVKAATQKAANINAAKSEIIRFGFLEGADIGSPIRNSLMELKGQMPNTVFKFEFLTHEQLNSRIETDDIDIAITLIEEVNQNNMLEYIPLRNLYHGIVAHESLPFAQSTQLNPKLLKEQPFYITSDGSRGFKTYVKKLCSQLKINESQLHIVANIESQILNVEAGMGISALSLTPRIANNTALKFFPLDDIKITIVAAWHRENNNEARKQLVKLIRKQYKAHGFF